MRRQLARLRKARQREQQGLEAHHQQAMKKIAEVTDEDTPVTIKSLLKARPFGIQYDSGIIQSVRHS